MSGSYLSREPYAPAVAGYVQPADVGNAGLAARTAAAGLADVSNKWADFWAQADRAAAVNEAGQIASQAAMHFTDMAKGFETDPDPATAPARFREAAAGYATEITADKSPAVQRYLQAHLQRLIPSAYAQVNHTASQRVRAGLLGTMQATVSNDTQALALASNDLTATAAIDRISATLGGNVHAGLIDQPTADRMLSAALRQAVTLRANAGDPGAATAAAAMLDRYKTRMDAGDVTALTTSLREPLWRQGAEDAARAAVGGQTETRARAQSVIDGLIARGLSPTAAVALAANAVAESGANPDTPPGDGGRSHHLFQWNDTRLAALRARYGANPTLDQQLDFAVWELNNTEASAGTALRAATDPAQAAALASRLYLRPRDTEGEAAKRSAIAAQLAAGGPPRAADREAALADVRRRLADAPLHVQLQGESYVTRLMADRENGDAQARAALGNDLRDLEAAYGAGRTGFDIPADRIRALLPPDQAQRTIDQLQLARTAGSAIGAIGFAAPDEVAALRQRLAPPDAADPYLAGQHAEMLARFDRGVEARNKALLHDPAGYVLQSPELQRMQQEGRPAAEIAAASLAMQRRMGLRDAQTRVLPDAQLQQIAELLRTTGPEKGDMAATLAQVQADLGPALFDRAFGELVHHAKIGWEWQAVAAMSAPTQAEGRALLQKALVLEAQKGGHEALRKLVPPDVLKGFDQSVADELAPLREALRYHPGGDALFDTIRRAVDTLGTYHAWRGADASKAVADAYQAVIGARWDLAGDDGSHMFSSGHTMLVPKGRAGEIETALAGVRDRLKPGDLTPLSDPTQPNATPAQLQAATLDAARRGVWINNADASGAVLKARTPGGTILDIRRADGTPIEVRFDALPRNAAAFIADPAADAATPPPARQPFDWDFSSWSRRAARNYPPRARPVPIQGDRAQ